MHWKEMPSTGGMQRQKKILKHHKNSIFGDAKYFTDKSWQHRLRLLARTPAEEDLARLKNILRREQKC